MDTQQQEDLVVAANELLNKHGLVGWKCVVDTSSNLSKRLGQCRYRLKEIAVSQFYLDAAPYAICWDTVVHEVAHALTPGSGHGAEWRAVATELGLVNPRSTKNLAELGITLPQSRGAVKAHVTIYMDSGCFVSSHGASSRPLSALERRYIKGNKAATMGKLYQVPLEIFEKFKNGEITNQELIEATYPRGRAPVIHQAASKVKGTGNQPTQSKSTFSAFTKSIYKTGMDFSTFQGAYLGAKPTASPATVKTQYYRVVKELG
jgi:hypothetical protein